MGRAGVERSPSLNRAGGHGRRATNGAEEALFLTHAGLYKHTSLGPAEKAVIELGKAGGFDVTTVERYKQEKSRRHSSGALLASKIYRSNSIIRSDFPVMKNRARRPARRSVPVPGSIPTACGYHCPPFRIFTGADHARGSETPGANET